MQQQNPKGISVIMPAYNSEKTIGRAVESVLAQSYPCLELVIVDDGSSDGTMELIKAYVQKDDRVRFFRNEVNMGVSASRNVGVQNARHDYVAFLDSDDYWLTDKLEKQVLLFEANPDSALCFTASAFISDDGGRSDYILHAPARVKRNEILRQNVISCSSVLARRADLVQTPMASRRDIHEDYAVWLTLLKRYPYAVGLDEPMLVYQVSSGSKSGNKFRAAGMQLRTYHHCQVPMLAACRYFLIYFFRNTMKYYNIKRTMKME